MNQWLFISSIEGCTIHMSNNSPYLCTNPSSASTSPTKCVAFLNFVASVAGQLSKPVESVPGFQMHSEDFPALPGTASKASGKLCSIWCVHSDGVKTPVILSLFWSPQLKRFQQHDIHIYIYTTTCNCLSLWEYMDGIAMSNLDCWKELNCSCVCTSTFSLMLLYRL